MKTKGIKTENPYYKHVFDSLIGDINMNLVKKLQKFNDGQMKVHNELLRKLRELKKENIVSKDLIDYVIYILDKIILMPDKIDLYQRLGEDYFDLKYKIKDDVDEVELVFRINREVYLRYLFENGEEYEDPYVYRGDNVPEWINTYTEKLKYNKIKEYMNKLIITQI